MELNFKLYTQCYMVAEFQTNHEKIIIGHSGLFEDKFQVLLNEFYLIYNALNGKQSISFPYQSEVVWHDDSIQYKWLISFNSINDPIHIKIIEISPSNKGYNKLLIDNPFSAKSLYNNIYESLHNIYMEHGLIGYRKNWDAGNYPIAEYLVLKADKYTLDIIPEHFIPASDDMEDISWKKKVSVEKEIKVLST